MQIYTFINFVRSLTRREYGWDIVSHKTFSLILSTHRNNYFSVFHQKLHRLFFSVKLPKKRMDIRWIAFQYSHIKKGKFFRLFVSCTHLILIVNVANFIWVEHDANVQLEHHSINEYRVFETNIWDNLNLR